MTPADWGLALLAFVTAATWVGLFLGERRLRRARQDFERSCDEALGMVRDD